LQLYGLFKYVTVSSLPASQRPSIFDFTGRAKWDAWTAAGNTYSTKADAESRYLEIAQSLGWSEGVVLPETTTASQSENIWDSDDDVKEPTKRSGETGGFGSSVSSMARPEDESDASLHGLAISNDLQGLVSLLQEDPDVNLDARDDFVCIQCLSFAYSNICRVTRLYTWQPTAVTCPSYSSCWRRVLIGQSRSPILRLPCNLLTLYAGRR
jgi:acyl-CoA-binding protein